MKKIIYFLILALCVISTTHWQDEYQIITDFKLVTSADANERISQGESRNIQWGNNEFMKIWDANKRYLSIHIEDINRYVTIQAYTTLDWKTLSPWLHYPVKWWSSVFDNFSVSSDARWCTNVWGGFYVHEYEYDQDTNNSSDRWRLK